MLGRMRMQLQVQEAQTGPAAATLVAGSTAGTAGHAELGDQLQRLHGAVQQLTQVFKQVSAAVLKRARPLPLLALGRPSPLGL